MGDIGAAVSRWRVWFLMANQDIGMRYRRSVIGPFWISLSLAAMVSGMALLYGQIFEREFSAYLTWLGCSFLAWLLLSALISEGCQIAIESEGQLRSIPIQLPVLAARVVHRNLVIFLHNALVIVGLFAIFGYAPAPSLVVAPLGVVMLLAFGFFIALVLGPLCLRFRDITQIIANILQISFFLTPIIWQPDQGNVRSVYVDANPFYHLIELVRAPILGHYPTALNWIVAITVLVATIILAFITLSVSRRKIFTWL